MTHHIAKKQLTKVTDYSSAAITTRIKTQFRDKHCLF